MHDPHGDGMTSGRQWELAPFLFSLHSLIQSLLSSTLIHSFTPAFILLGITVIHIEA